jgi:hypothetical protein
VDAAVVPIHRRAEGAATPAESSDRGGPGERRASGIRAGNLRRIAVPESPSDTGFTSAIRLPQSGTATLEELARLAVELAVVHGPARLELGAGGVVRTLWFEDGVLVAAESTLRHESLLDRARRDGLIDSRQHSSLRLMRAMPPGQIRQLLKDRGYIREEEAAPLAQRYTEQIALEGLSEPRSDYALSAEPPPPGLALATGTRPLIEIAVDALRRSLDGAEQLGQLGGLASIPSIARGAERFVNELHLGQREDHFLALVDGETTVEELARASGLRDGGALKLLAAVLALGWLEVTAPEIESASPPPPTLELERLEGKFQQVQEADYFAILGLSRAAGGEEVQRAYAQLSAEFHPLKYAGHPDANVHHRARQVQDALSEAAHVLRDDRLRASYSRHLVD